MNRLGRDKETLFLVLGVTTLVVTLATWGAVRYIRDDRDAAATPPAWAKPWGSAGDVPVLADYSGDDAIEVAVWRPSNGVWYVNDRVTPQRRWGRRGDIPVPADYTGDGKADRAVWRPSTGEWLVDAPVRVRVWGALGDIPVPADYTGDGKAERAVWRPSTGRWYVDIPESGGDR